MAQQQTYLLRVWRNKAPGGWQWAAQVQHLTDGQDRRFTDPEAFLVYLRAITCAPEPTGGASPAVPLSVGTPGQPGEERDPS